MDYNLIWTKTYTSILWIWGFRSWVLNSIKSRRILNLSFAKKYEFLGGLKLGRTNFFGNFLEFSCLKFLQFLDFLHFYVLLNSFTNLFFYCMKILWTNEFWVYKNSWVLIFGWIFTKLEFGQKYTYSFFKTRTWINLITLVYLY